ncbi:hypothetical protein BKA83DRAFT_4311877 [Pisolithus microcarpus]|nr:hypothetical protein BKA83DRAFT_4311877 [Pisolithus microcarpus]
MPVVGTGGRCTRSCKSPTPTRAYVRVSLATDSLRWSYYFNELYTPQTQHNACRTVRGGATVLAGSQDVDDQRYIVYKVDGSSLHVSWRSPCGNVNGEYSASIMLQMVEEDALTPTGDPFQILDRGSQGGPLVEVSVLILRNGCEWIISHIRPSSNRPL